MKIAANENSKLKLIKCIKSIDFNMLKNNIFKYTWIACLNDDKNNST